MILSGLFCNTPCQNGCNKTFVMLTCSDSGNQKNGGSLEDFHFGDFFFSEVADELDIGDWCKIISRFPMYTLG
jgi:hypothetical protein